MCSKIIERGIHVFMFKWWSYLHEGGEIHHHRHMDWKNFLNYNKALFASITNNLLHPIYTTQRSSTHIHNKHNSVIPPDIAICERLLYPGDWIVTINGIVDKETNKKGYVVISAFGTVLTKYDGDINIEKLGAIQYADEIVRILKLFKNITLDNWLSVLVELDMIQTNIILVQQITEISSTLTNSVVISN